jgi:hypothetical protein
MAITSKALRRAILVIPLVGCGQDASFTENVSTGARSAGIAGEGESGLDSTAEAASIDSEVATEDVSGSVGDSEASDVVADAAGNGSDTAAEDMAADGAGDEGDEAGAPKGVPPKVTAEDLAKKCATGKVTQLVQNIVFAKPATTCDWGTDANPKMGNLGRKDGRVSARFEQEVALKVPDNALICGLTLDFVDDTTAGQSMRYDDEIFLNFNNVILAASQSYAPAFTMKDGHMMYSWDGLVGKKYGYGLYEPYCAGAETGKGECFIPPTETTGLMKLNFDDSLIQSIAASTGIKVASPDKPVAGNKTDFRFNFVTTGDNDDSDCQHSKFEFKISAKYVVYQ